MSVLEILGMIASVMTIVSFCVTVVKAILKHKKDRQRPAKD